MKHFICVILCCATVACGSFPGQLATTISPYPLQITTSPASSAIPENTPTILSGQLSTASLPPTSDTKTSVQMHLGKIVSITTDTEGGSARPEIVATADRVFVLYLGNIAAGRSRTFNLKIYDSDLHPVIASRELIATTQEYGAPTDIRVDSDGQYLYAFYETQKKTSPTTAITYLWGAKFTLDERFDQVAATPTPITSSKPISELSDGGELLDDPAPLVGENSVFVMTRLKYSLASLGRTVYRIREFSKTDLSKLSEFDLDFSQVSDGGAQVASLRFSGDHSILIALATVLSTRGAGGDYTSGAFSDIMLVRMRSDWTFDPQKDAKTISAEPEDRENYVSGLDTDGDYFYLTYIQSFGDPATGEHIGWIKIFDREFHLLCKEKVKDTSGNLEGGVIRPSIEVFGNRIFSGQSSGQGVGKGNAEVYVYGVVRDETT